MGRFNKGLAAVENFGYLLVMVGILPVLAVAVVPGGLDASASMVAGAVNASVLGGGLIGLSRLVRVFA